MDSITYKCPNCDGGLEFDPASQKFRCSYCLSEFTEEELIKLTPDHSHAVEAGEMSGEPPEAGDGGADTEPDGTYEGTGPDCSETEMGETDGQAMMLYTCPSCGAELVTDETTAATFCYYCHNPVVLTGRMEGSYRPDCVIPFEMDREKAEEVFKGWIGRKKYIPGDFYSPKQTELMEGIYYPYWLYDCEVDGWISADTVKLHVTRAGSTEYTETSRFRVERKGTMRLENVTRNALRKADHRLAEGVLPFDMQKLKDFQAGYLSGFKAERRDQEWEIFEQDIRSEVSQFAMNSLKESISGYNSVNVTSHEERMRSSTWRYALFPVWVLTYRDNKTNRLYYFAMNGQSGKVCGVLPVDYKRLAGLFAMIFLPLFMLFIVGGYLI